MFHSLYYTLKPLIPRRLQISLRRALVQRKRKKYTHIWPIDERAGKPPEGWKGWPDGKQFALVLTHDVESAKGVERCLDLAKLEKRLGFRSSFNFVAGDYHIPQEIFDYLNNNGFEIGIHGISHAGNIFRSDEHFRKQALKINDYLKKWGAVGFRAPCMYHNLKLVGELNIQYDASTFDTDPFEPQPDGVSTIFPFWVNHKRLNGGYVELPYTLSQDHTLFIVMGEKEIGLWLKKLDWVAKQGGMALLGTHPDYMSFNEEKPQREEYPADYYEELLNHIGQKYREKYWHVLPKTMARFWLDEVVKRSNGKELLR